MNVHHASIFRYSAYQDDMNGFVKQVDQQIYSQLQERTCQSIENFQNSWPLTDCHHVFKFVDGKSKQVPIQEWPLWEHGGSNLISVEQVMNQSVPKNDVIAYWFLIILGEYLDSCTSPLGNWIILNNVLIHCGWKQKDCDLLFRGSSTSKLLKPEKDMLSPWPLRNEDPYWLWLQPDMARSGWLTLAEVERLHTHLKIMEQQVSKFNVRRIPNINIENPVVVADYRESLDSAYRDTMNMLSKALEHQLGLFMSITTYS